MAMLDVVGDLNAIGIWAGLAAGAPESRRPVGPRWIRRRSERQPLAGLARIAHHIY